MSKTCSHFKEPVANGVSLFRPPNTLRPPNQLPPYPEYPYGPRQEISSLIVDRTNANFCDLEARANAVPTKVCRTRSGMSGCAGFGDKPLPGCCPTKDCQGCAPDQQRDATLTEHYRYDQPKFDVQVGLNLCPERYCRSAASLERWQPEYALSPNFALCADISPPWGQITQGDWGATSACVPGTIEAYNFNSDGRMAFCQLPVAMTGRVDPNPLNKESCAEKQMDAYRREFYPYQQSSDYLRPRSTAMTVWEAEQVLGSAANKPKK